jgi:LysR family nitrogen assimilation transcriptional regulator
LFTEGVCLVERADSRPRFGSTIDVPDLAGIPLLLCGYSNTMRMFLEHAFKQMDAKTNFRCEINTASLLLDLVIEGAGVGVLPRCAIASRNIGDSIRITRINQLELSRAIATSSDRAGSACVTQLSTIISQHVWDLITSSVWPAAHFDGDPPSIAQAV